MPFLNNFLQYDFSVDKYIEHEYEQDDTHDRYKLVALCAQKLFMYLGDLSRYKELAGSTTGFVKARG